MHPLAPVPQPKEQVTVFNDFAQDDVLVQQNISMCGSSPSNSPRLHLIDWVSLLFVLLIQQLKDLKRDRANVQPVEDERIPELTDPRLLAETSKLTLRRKPAEANTLLILEPVLKKFVEVRLSIPCLSIPSYITTLISLALWHDKPSNSAQVVSQQKIC